VRGSSLSRGNHCGGTILVSSAKVKKAENIRHFGPIYLDYLKRSKTFIPFLI